MAFVLPSWCAAEIGTKRTESVERDAQKRVKREPTGRPRPTARRSRAQLREDERQNYTVNAMGAQMQKLMTLVVKSELNLHQRTRTLEGFALDCFITADSNPVPTAMLNAKSKYEQTVVECCASLATRCARAALI